MTKLPLLLTDGSQLAVLDQIELLERCYWRKYMLALVGDLSLLPIIFCKRHRIAVTVV